MSKDAAYIILFSGHMIDDKNRTTERFPDYKTKQVKNNIKAYLKQFAHSGLAIASGASGGDILFHESCMELGIPSEIYLAEDIDAFRKDSVSNAGKDWEKRFDKIINKLPVHILPEEYKNVVGNIWEQTNIWIMDTAITLHKKENKKIILLTIWNEIYEGKLGGTEHFIDVAKKYDCITHNINPLKI